MKTLTIINNLKKLGTGIIASLILTTSVVSASEGAVPNASMSHLEDFIAGQEQMIMYVAPVMIETEDVSVAMERLESFVELSEVALKYVAPTPEMEWLNNFTDTAEASLRYEAPAEDENVETVPALERLEMLAETTEASLRYEAPAIDEVVFDLDSENTDSLMVETK